MTVFDRIAAALAAPKTHRVATIYACGRIDWFDARSVSDAEIFAVGERRKIGRDLVSINDDLSHGPVIRAVSVEIASIQ